MAAYGLLVDGVLVGTWAVRRPDVMKAAVSGDITPYAYLLSDFRWVTDGLPRLSALVLRAALSREGQLLAERALHGRVEGWCDGVFQETSEYEVPWALSFAQSQEGW